MRLGPVGSMRSQSPAVRGRISRMCYSTAATVDALPHRASVLYMTAFICHLLLGQKDKSPAVTTALPATTTTQATTTTTPEPTTVMTTPAPTTPTTTTTTPPPPTTIKARAAVHKVRDAGELYRHL